MEVVVEEEEVHHLPCQAQAQMGQEEVGNSWSAAEVEEGARHVRKTL